MNVNGTPGMYEPLYIRSMELTFDALPVTITIPSDETASLPIGSEIQVQRLGDSPVIFEGGTAVEPEFIRYQPIPGANPAAFAVAIEPVTSVNQWNESVSTRP